MNPDPGYKTTEFALVVGINLLNGFAQAGIFPSEHWSVKVAGFVAAAVSAAMYVHSRGAVKSAVAVAQAAPALQPAVMVTTGSGANTQDVSPAMSLSASKPAGHVNWPAKAAPPERLPPAYRPTIPVPPRGYTPPAGRK